MSYVLKENLRLGFPPAPPRPSERSSSPAAAAAADDSSAAEPVSSDSIAETMQYQQVLGYLEGVLEFFQDVAEKFFLDFSEISKKNRCSRMLSRLKCYQTAVLVESLIRK